MGSCNGEGRNVGPGRKHLRHRIRHFTPAWHTVNMGTGVISLLFHNFPYGNATRAMQIIALTVHLFNLALFVIFTCCDATRYLWFRDVWPAMIQHPVQSLYIGSFPMGFATIINASVGILYQRFHFGGSRFLYALWGLWWVDVAMSVIICFGQLHMMSARQTHAIDSMTTVWILPVVTLIVASSTGVVIAEALQALSLSHASVTLAVSFVIVVIGVSFALMIITVYLYRLIVHGLPEGITIYSSFLPLGPMGQAGYSFLLMGQVSRTLMPHTSVTLLSESPAPQIINLIFFCISCTLWSLATAWLVLAVLALAETLPKKQLPFKLTFWGMIFPNGVYANLTILLASTFDSSFFRIWGSIYACFTLCLWTFAVMRTVPSVLDGNIFQAPCLDDEEVVGRLFPTEPSQFRTENEPARP